MTEMRNRIGAELERAVEVIERAIIEQDSRLKNATFKIERRKIVIEEGVRYEVDVLVTSNPGEKDEARYIFECKNWSRPVGKAQVVLFEDSIGVTRARAGFLVAARYTKDARLRSLKCRKMHFLKATKEFASPLTERTILHNEIDFVSLSARIADRANPERTPLRDFDLANEICTVNRTKMAMREFLVRTAERFIQAHLDAKQHILKLEGQYSFIAHGSVQFQPGEFSVAGVDVARIEVQPLVRVLSDWAVLMSKYDISGRGRIHTYAANSELTPDKPLVVEVVETKTH